MTDTGATASLLERYRELMSGENPRDYELRYQLQILLQQKYNPNVIVDDETAKKLAEFEKYFNWEESYSLNFDTTFYVEHSPS